MHTVDQKIKSRAIHRAKIIKGQIEALIKAIDKEEYCVGILEQSLSIQRSLKSMDALLLENHLKTHVRHQICRKGEEDKAVKELIEIYNLSNR